MKLLDIIRTKGNKYKWFKTLFMPISRLIRERDERAMNRLFKAHGQQLFEDVYDVLGTEVDFWPEFGTLLGIYRDKGFIKHDNDLDFAIKVEDADKVKELMIKNGFTLKKEYIGINHPEIRQLTLVKNGLGVDFFCYSTHDSTMSVHIFHMHDVNLSEHKTYYRVRPINFQKFGTIKHEFLGRQILIPANCHEHLQLLYGPTYMTPDPNFKNPKNNMLDNVLAVDLQSH